VLGAPKVWLVFRQKASRLVHFWCPLLNQPLEWSFEWSWAHWRLSAERRTVCGHLSDFFPCPIECLVQTSKSAPLAPGSTLASCCQRLAPVTGSSDTPSCVVRARGAEKVWLFSLTTLVLFELGWSTLSIRPQTWSTN